MTWKNFFVLFKKHFSFYPLTSIQEVPLWKNISNCAGTPPDRTLCSVGDCKEIPFSLSHLKPLLFLIRIWEDKRVKEYSVLGTLCLLVSLYVLLSGCTMSLVSTQKETPSQQNTIAFQETEKNCVKFRAKDGINTYIIKDGNGKIVGMGIAKEPWVNIPVPKSYSDTKTSLLNQDRQQKVPSLISGPPTFTEVKKAVHKSIDEKREPVFRKNRHEKSVVEKSPPNFGNDSDSGINTDAKAYGLNDRMDLLLKTLYISTL